ncbi:nuclear transport factor 2 family protein [Kaistia algarum]|uniref:nuclear transport factor 2 family protein n=1 Tax=Kaistia algarum TaxID=2083279 RepID=UPI002256B097|nr:nuclear transport factor 2 family protein [Kaistia algarum]MCX5515746.1 nuclear transport factor 2 family protein [Kaistia algarum]
MYAANRLSAINRFRRIKRTIWHLIIHRDDQCFQIIGLNRALFPRHLGLARERKEPAMTDVKTLNAEELLLRSLDLLPRDLHAWAALFAEDAVFELPYAGTFDAPTKRQGREAILAGMTWFRSLIDDLRIGEVTVHKLVGRDAVVAEYTATGKMSANGKSFDQIYIVRVEAKGGRITHFSEYFDTLRFKKHLEG